MKELNSKIIIEKIKKGNKEIKKIAMKIIPVLKKYGVKKAGIFGSYARGEENKKSDVDILVEFEKGRGFFDLVRLERELKLISNKKIDLITYNSLNHLLKKRILNEEVKIL